MNFDKSASQSDNLAAEQLIHPDASIAFGTNGERPKGRGDLAEQRSGADALQLTLRFRFRARLTASVDMTSEVKRWLQMF